MSQPAAAQGDPAAHFGFIALGSPNVFIGNRPAARVGAAAGAGSYYHKKEKRRYISLNVGVALSLGLEGAFKISVGREYAPEEPAIPKPAPKPAPYVNTLGFGQGGVPGTIIMGNMRLLIR